MKKLKKGKHRKPKPKRRAKPKPPPKGPARSYIPPTDLPSSGVGGSPAGFGAFGAAPTLAAEGNRLAAAASALDRGDPHGAFELCREVLAANPYDAGALNLAGVAAFQAGLAEDALRLLQAAAAQAPEDAETETNLGNVLSHLGRVGDAVLAYERAIAADPEHGDAHFNMGVLLEADGQRVEALDAFRNTIELAPTHALAWQGLGNVQIALGRLDEAKASLQTSLEHDPGLVSARTNLASVHHELGDFASAAGHCRTALDREPDIPEARYNLGLALQETGRFLDAVEAYEKVLVHQPEHAAAAMNIAYARQQLGQLDEAALAFQHAIRIDPGFAKAHANLADLKLQQGDPAAALEVCDAYLDRHPGSPDLLACKALALGDLGDDKAAALVDFDRLLRHQKIEVPAGYVDLGAFNAALSAHVLDHPSLTYAPRSHATRQGRHSGELLSEPKGPFADMETLIFRAVDAYKAALGTDPDHPFLNSPPTQMMLSIWGVVMETAGHQIPHIHPAAWLSGVYYPKVPEVVAAETPDQAGWIEFGRPPAHFHNTNSPSTRMIQPEPGLMILFPSYFYHRTIPFQADETRISIAFDLMPA